MTTRSNLYSASSGIAPDGSLIPPAPREDAEKALRGNVVAPLDHLAIVSAGGIDANDFLQGQVSNDIRKLTRDQAQLAAYNSPKGRVLAVLHLSRMATMGDVLIEVHDSIAESLLKRLNMFILRSKVNLSAVSLPTVGLAGPNAAEILLELGLPSPEQVNATFCVDDLQVIRRQGVLPRFTLRGAPAHIAELWATLIRSARPMRGDIWRLLDILSGVPVVYPETQDHFVAQMINLDLLGGISFEKGCYTGQEIVARLHYLGKLKRRMFLLYANCAEIEPGAAILEGNENGSSVGEVVDSFPCGGGRSAVGAVLHLSHLDSTTLRVKGAGAATLTPATAFAHGLPSFPN